MEDPIQKKQNNEKLSNCITHALNLDNLFKLYAYRCIEPTIFTELVETEVNNFKSYTNEKNKTLLD